MFAIASLLVIVLIGLLITRVATSALVATGLSSEYARFQSRSAFTGVGFTTNEAEAVVSHPVRRRIVMALMLLGNAGIASVMAGILLGFQGSDATDATQRVMVLAGGLVLIWGLASSSRIDRQLRRLLTAILARFTDLEVRDYARLLRVTGDYVVDELAVTHDDWLCDRTLRELGLREEGVLVLGIVRRGSYLGTPQPETRVAARDVLLLYGRQDVITDIDERRRDLAGQLAHVDRAGELAVVKKQEAERHERM